MKRLAKVGISVELIQSIMTVGWSGRGMATIAGLPEDASFVYAYQRVIFGAKGEPRTVIWLVFEHESFEKVETSQEIPEVSVRVSYKDQERLTVD